MKTIEDIRRYAYLFNCFCSMIHLLTNHRMQVRREEEGVRISELVVVVGLALCDNTEVEAGPANTNTPTRASSLPSLPLTAQMAQDSFSQKYRRENSYFPF